MNRSQISCASWLDTPQCVVCITTETVNRHGGVHESRPALPHRVGDYDKVGNVYYIGSVLGLANAMEPALTGVGVRYAAQRKR